MSKSLSAILMLLATLLGTVSASPVVQQFIGDLVIHHPILSTIGVVLGMLGTLLHPSPIKSN